MKLLLAALAISAFAFDTSAMAAQKPPIVLVHGAFEDAQVWGHVTSRLQTDGYKVVAVELPGRPGAPATPDKVSLDLYRDTVVAALNEFHRPAVVVGHSFGGIVIADAAETAPKKIKTLIFVEAGLAFTFIISPGLNGFGTFLRAGRAGILRFSILTRPGI